MAWYNFWKREDKPRKRAYAGAMYNRLVSDWIAQGTSADSEIKTSITALRNRARQLERDNDYIRGFLRAVENNVVGEGIGFQAQAKMQRGGKLDDRINDMIESKWAKWTRKDSCHTGGTLSFQDIERLAIRSVARDGEFYIRIVKRPFGFSKIPLALELIEADRLDDGKGGKADNGNEIRMGVELDQWNRPVKYYFHDRHPGDYNIGFGSPQVKNHIVIPADEIIPLFVSERSGQTRGVSWLSSAIMKLHHLHGYTEAEVIAARAGASVMGFIETDSGEVIGDDVEAGQRVTEFEPGVFKQLNPGERVNVPKIDRPGGQFAPFVKAMLQGVAAGLGMSYESFSKDYSGSTYSSARQALLEERDLWRAMQKWMIRNFHQIVFEKWLEMAVISGELSLANYEIMPENYQNVKWMPRGFQWIDPLKEVTGFKEAIKGGLLTQTQVIAQTGGDIEDLMTQRAREVQMAQDMGLVFDTDASLDSQPVQTDPALSQDGTQNQ